MTTRNRIAMAVLAAALLSSTPFVPQARAIYLQPGATVDRDYQSYPIGGTILDSTTVSFSSAIVSGSLVSSVISGDSANPYVHGGGLTFTYEFTLAPSSANVASEFSIGSFGSFNTYVFKNSDNGGVYPLYFSRSNEGNGMGDIVTFNFHGNSVFPGQTTALLVIQTDAMNWAPTTANVITDLGLSLGVASLAPITVPEPGTWSLLLLGVLGFTFRRRL